MFCLMAVLSAVATAGTANEPVDLAAYAAIRNEGLTYSRAMEFATTLADDFGPRLTGSANLSRENEWARDTLAHFGSTSAHLEDFGEFGLQWQQLNTWMRTSAPDSMVFVVQAAPWSASTRGPVVERLSPPDLAQASVVEAIFVLNSANRERLLPRATHE
jgi:hypothetical protein